MQTIQQVRVFAQSQIIGQDMAIVTANECIFRINITMYNVSIMNACQFS